MMRYTRRIRVCLFALNVGLLLLLHRTAFARLQPQSTTAGKFTSLTRGQHSLDFIALYSLLFVAVGHVSKGTCIFLGVARQSCPSVRLTVIKTMNMCSNSMNILNWCLTLELQAHTHTRTHSHAHLLLRSPRVSTCQWPVFLLPVGPLPIVSQSTSMTLSAHQPCNCEQLSVP